MTVIARYLGMVLCCALVSAVAAAQQRPFTVADDIAMSRFVDPFGTRMRSPVQLSPDGRYAAFVTERGVLGRNVVEDTLWLVVVDDVTRALGAGAAPPQALAVPVVMRAGSRAPAISYVQWLGDSGGFLFIAANTSGKHQLFRIGVGSGETARPISNEDQDVSSFDVNGGHIVYSALSPVDEAAESSDGTAVAGSGKSFFDLALSGLPGTPVGKLQSLCDLWISSGDKPVQLVDKASGLPVRVHQRPNSYDQPVFKIAPDGRSVAAEIVEKQVPQAWESLPPAPDLPRRRIKAGAQDVDAKLLWEASNEFAIIDAETGRAESLTDGPIGFQNSYYTADPEISWAPDGRHLALANTYLGSKVLADPFLAPADMRNDRPCIAVADMALKRAACVIRLPESKSVLHDQGMHRYTTLHFEAEGRQLVVDAMPELRDGGGDHGNLIALRFEQTGDNNWKPAGTAAVVTGRSTSIDLGVKQDLNTPPLLQATDRSTGAVMTVLDPNPGLRSMPLGDASVYHWRDNAGRTWTGGIVKPPGYTPGQRYPLVIQTHGIEPMGFMSFGSFPSCMAARELAASGFVVLQAGGFANDQSIDTLQEASSQVAGYDAVVKQLAREGVVDPERVGIIGFSRTVYSVLASLERGRTKFTAASICDGMQAGYLEYLLAADSANNAVKHEYDALNGAPASGAGLKTWLDHSPDFNLHRVHAPLLVQAFGKASMIFMWEPYAALRLMDRPVDLLMIRAYDEHVLSNPATRMASQGADVDWFRFWLQGHEDADTAKAAQYRRWEGLCDRQVAQNPDRRSSCVRSKAPAA